MRRVVGAGSTTPGLMLLIGVVLVLLGLLAGLFAVLAVGERSDAARSVATGSEPLGVQTQEIYRALADADATAAAGLLEGGVESADVRTRYQAAINTAASTLIQATAAGSSGRAEASALNTIGVLLPEYARLVERARAETRQGNTVGAAYLRSASNNVMRAQILPAAKELHDLAAKRLADDHREATSIPWVPLAILLIGVVAFGAALRFFARRTHRRINVGLLLGAMATIASVIWLWTGTAASREDLDRSRSDGWGSVETLAQARFLALRAHGDESLTLVMRGSDNGRYEGDFADAFKALVQGDGMSGEPILEQAARRARGDAVTLRSIAQARDAAVAWGDAHTRLTTLYKDGDFEAAVDQVTEVDGASRVAFARIDEALGAAVAEDQKDFTRAVASGRDALAGIGVGVGVLALIAAAAAVDGVRREVRRYNRP